MVRRVLVDRTTRSTMSLPHPVPPADEPDDGSLLAAVAASLVLATGCLILLVHSWILASWAVVALVVASIGLAPRSRRRMVVLTVAGGPLVVLVGWWLVAVLAPVFD